MIASFFGLRVEGNLVDDGFLTVQKLFPGGPVALANEEAVRDDPDADVVGEGDVLMAVGEHELSGLSEEGLLSLFEESRKGGDVVLEFAHRFVRSGRAELENFSVVVQAATGSDSMVEEVDSTEVVDLNSKAGKKNVRAKKAQELSDKRKAKSEESTTVTASTSSYLQELAAAPPVWVPPGGDLLSRQQEEYRKENESKKGTGR